MTAFVVAVSGGSGAGKSSLVQRTAELLGDAVVVHFDAYVESSSYPVDLRRWLDEGANVDLWKTPGLAAAVRALRGGEARHVLLEEPFGKLRGEMRDLIDFSVHLRVPADVLLARRLKRRLQEDRNQGEALLNRVRNDLEFHLATGRDLETVGAAAVEAVADRVMPGTRPLEELARELVSEIHARRP